MGTKTDPGAFGCYAAAYPDEPYFLLLARDASAPDLVEQWARLRIAAVQAGEKPVADLSKAIEALDCAKAMRGWVKPSEPLALPKPSGAETQGPAVKSGLAQSRMGRPVRPVEEAERLEIVRRLAAGDGVNAIARSLGRPTTTICNYNKKLKASRHARENASGAAPHAERVEGARSRSPSSPEGGSVEGGSDGASQPSESTAGSDPQRGSMRPGGARSAKPPVSPKPLSPVTTGQRAKAAARAAFAKSQPLSIQDRFRAGKTVAEADRAAIERHIAENGVTQCPPKFAEVTDARVPEDEAKRRIEAIELPAPETFGRNYPAPQPGRSP